LRVKLLGTAGALLVLALVLVALPAAGASDPTETATAAFHGKAKNGVYIVRMADLPAVAYDGSIAGYKATQPDKGKKIDPNAPDVVKYVGYLKSSHDASVGNAGGTKLYDYSFSLNGYAAKLTVEQAHKISAQPGILSVEPDRVQHMDTLTTPAFLGLSQPGGTWDQLGGVGKAGEDIIVGDVDTGVWPENPAFSDRTGTGPQGQDGKLAYQQLPGWHGKCTPGEDFPASDCNQKLIGAQYFYAGHGLDTIIPEDYVSARDFDGHGSHTASTAAGNNGVQVTGDLPAALLGKISGMAPRARIAVYKACWELADHSQVGCFSSDTAAAIDQAVADGVDVINYSISGSTTNFLDSVEVAFLFAQRAGVFVSASAGNSGPTASTVAHPAPWVTTVAASSHNRTFQSIVTLGNGATYQGVSVTQGAPSSPLILASAAGLPGADPNLVRQCFSASSNGNVAVLDPAKVAGKIVVCERGGAAPANARVDKPLAVSQAGGVGTIIANISANTLVGDIHVAPAVHVDNVAFAAITAYVGSTATPTASFSAGTPVLTAPAPFIAAFSSRGPSLASADQLKPDLSAPGVDVLAAVAPPNHSGRNFDLESGTSMSAPHVAGLAALIMQAHRDWSPDMVKSAMMTTAYNLLGPLDELAQGAGHVDPTKFLNPGLVYKSGFADYVKFLCGTGQLVQASCASAGGSIAPNQLNLPSMAIGSMAGNATLTRTVTNVTSQSETYALSTSGLGGLLVTPSTSSFTIPAGGSASYSVTFSSSSTTTFNVYAQGFVTLTGDHGHVVRIPVVVRPVALAAPDEVFSTGSGDKTYGIVAGYAGTLAYSTRGLVASSPTPLTVPLDPLFSSGNPRSTNAPETDVTIGAGVKLARFSIFQSDTTGNDLDLFVYKVTGTTLSLVGSSTGPTADETVNLTNPAAGDYAVFVDGFDTNGASTTTTLHTWQLGTASAGNMTATGPTTTTIAGAGTVTLHFTGLTAGSRYLGAVDYSNGTSTIGTTIVRVNP
jgi:hypothetical protein